MQVVAAAHMGAADEDLRDRAAAARSLHHLGAALRGGGDVDLGEGDALAVKQALGGTWTVTVNGNMARIDGTDGDAIGMQPLELNFDPAEADGSVRRNDIDKVLRTIFDPEIPVNIYDLGLIYAVEVDDESDCTITMTLTTPHCPVAESMPAEVELRAASVPGIRDADVNLVWDPPWDPQKMSDEARLELGML